MKVFVSHQQRDSDLATAIGGKLERNGIQVYLDIIDPLTGKTGDDLGDYIRMRLTECSTLMSVVSEYTKNSWWVPWEIGIATEKDYPITTFARDNTELPIYLKKWPYLRTDSDLDAYIKYAKLLESKILEKQYRELKSHSEARRLATKDFHRDLKLTLRQ
jgi:TIR domain